MLSAKWLIPIVCASSAMLAQTANDLNGLVSAAANYVSSGMSGSHDPQTLALSKISGNSGSVFPDVLMTKATDVQHWTFLYRINTGHPKDEASLQDPAPQTHTAVMAECTQGIFNNFRYSGTPVTGVKSLQFTWVAVSLDNAILNLNANGYVRGFSTVDLMRPDITGFPDEYVYVFNCPWERRECAVSCQTGALVWTYGY